MEVIFVSQAVFMFLLGAFVTARICYAGDRARKAMEAAEGEARYDRLMAEEDAKLAQEIDALDPANQYKDIIGAKRFGEPEMEKLYRRWPGLERARQDKREIRRMMEQGRAAAKLEVERDLELRNQEIVGRLSKVVYVQDGQVVYDREWERKRREMNLL